MNIKVIFIPGNGGGKPSDNWFPYVGSALQKEGLQIIVRDFPDNDLAREAYWIPFIEEELKADQNSILVGHSSGAIAAMRYAESHPILGSVLVGAYHTDLGYEKEQLSGYFNRPWQWEKIRRNQRRIILFASIDDPWIPIEEPRFIQKQLNAVYYEYTDKGHFGGDYLKLEFPELVTAIKEKILSENL